MATTSAGSPPGVPSEPPTNPGSPPPADPPPPSSTGDDGDDGDDGDEQPTPTSVVPTQPPPPETTTSAVEPTETSAPPEPTTSSEPPPPETTTSQPPETTSTPEEPTTTSTTEEPTTSIPEETTSEEPTSTTEVITSTAVDSTATSIVTVTTTRSASEADPTTTGQTGEPTPINPGGGGGSGSLDSGAKIAIGVVVPIVSIAILALVGLFFWKKRRARREAEEERRKEVEDYSYNPNADPTIPNVMGGGDGGYEMREDSSGYRGWGTTAAGSTGRKASTTMSGGWPNSSDAHSPTQGHASVARSDEVYSPEGEILGAMGPAAANNRGTGVNRGPSNASSSYSAANRSDNSDGAMSYGNGATYYDQQGHGPYGEGYAGGNGGGAQELSAAPVIRDNPARRNTRIENPSHYPQQSAGISQNF